MVNAAVTRKLQDAAGTEGYYRLLAGITPVLRTHHICATVATRFGTAVHLA